MPSWEKGGQHVNVGGWLWIQWHQGCVTTQHHKGWKAAHAVVGLEVEVAAHGITAPAVEESSTTWLRSHRGLETSVRKTPRESCAKISQCRRLVMLHELMVSFVEVVGSK